MAQRVLPFMDKCYSITSTSNRWWCTTTTHVHHTCPVTGVPGTCTTLLMRYCLCIQYIHSYYTGTCTPPYTLIYIIILYVQYHLYYIKETKKVRKDFSYAFMHNFHVWLRYGYIFLLFFYTCVYGTDVHTHDHLLPPPLLPFFFFFCFPPPLSWPPRFPLP